MENRIVRIMTEQSDGAYYLEQLQNHEHHNVFEKAQRLLEGHFDVEEPAWEDGGNRGDVKFYALKGARAKSAGKQK